MTCSCLQCRASSCQLTLGQTDMEPTNCLAAKPAFRFGWGKPFFLGPFYSECVLRALRSLSSFFFSSASLHAEFRGCRTKDGASIHHLPKVSHKSGEPRRALRMPISTDLSCEPYGLYLAPLRVVRWSWQRP